MTVIDGRAIERIAELENEIASLRSHIEGYGRGDESTGEKRPVRIADLTEGATSYPSGGTSNTFPAAFQDALYTATQGAQTVTPTDRQDDGSQHVIRQLAGAYLFEDARLSVFRHNERWWTTDGELTHDAVVTESGGIATGSSGTVEIYRSGSPSGVTVTAHHDWPTTADPLEEDAPIRIRYFVDEQKYRVVVASAGQHILRLALVNTSAGYLDHNEIGNVDWVDQTGALGVFVENGTSSDATNVLMTRIWNGALVCIGWIPGPTEASAKLSADGLTIAEADNLTISQADNMTVISEEASEGWYIIQAYSANHLRGKLTDELLETDATATINNIIQVDGFYPISDPTSAVTVHNIFGVTGEYGDDVIAIWDDETNEWILFPAGGGGGGARLYYGIADEDIDHGDFGNVVIHDFDPTQTVEVENTMSTRVWSGSPVVVARTELISDTAPTVLQDYRIVNAYTATEIRGEIKTQLDPSDTVATLENVKPLNGHYSPADLNNVSVNNFPEEFGCVGYPAFATWDETESQWQLRLVKRPTHVWGYGPAGEDHCGGSEPAITITQLTGFGYDCPTSELTILNPRGFRFKAGDTLDVIIDVETKIARIIGVELRPLDIVSSVEYDSGSHKLIENLQTIVASYCQGETPVDIAQFLPVAAVGDLSWDDPHLVGTRTAAWVIEVDGLSDSQVDFYDCDGGQ